MREGMFLYPLTRRNPFLRLGDAESDPSTDHRLVLSALDVARDASQRGVHVFDRVGRRITVSVSSSPSRRLAEALAKTDRRRTSLGQPRRPTLRGRCRRRAFLRAEIKNGSFEGEPFAFHVIRTWRYLE
jgi:hypothetical protein